mmetsp:Transcript_25085/g.54702  ORF Transcript_25085/g.54702 Transcript_25085/m.54702 type:complete len:607 (+) Transcript_25085:94-1914(+)|eukprot:CAMPEP_0178497692 /NCGR_PEP_ID=MMETSP0696-20121128/14831_1 /TAXON_ID=265572 /ORGANISM="Extubocellulus spinifer, Strain CCMP396" /LENGTH=606 /DNA_ID=CAMNT_0020126149 /DNA_START=44 /DNA_END=1864 /DNA_ORIENTATION=+
MRLHVLATSGTVAAVIPSLVGGFSASSHCNKVAWPKIRRHTISTCNTGSCTSRTSSLSVSSALHSSSSTDDGLSTSRRDVLTSVPLSVSAFLGALASYPLPAQARLVRFPCKPGELKNNYNFMRSGESLLESEGMWGSNPLFLTNRENALSDAGAEQVRMACADMLERDLNPSVVLYPTAANAIDTADIVATEMRIGRNRVLPEYTNLDARGIGKYDMNDRETVKGAIWAMDAESGPEGRSGERPPPTDDGTPNETLANQVTRLRQLMAVCETNFSGDDVLFIFPDNTGPALLSCLIAGIDLNRVHELEFTPGEVRYDITMESTLERLRAGPAPEYLETIRQGKIQLANLRSNPDLIVNVKDRRQLEEMQAEEERVRLAKAAKEAKEERARAAKKAEEERVRAAKEAKEESARAAKKAVGERKAGEDAVKSGGGGRRLRASMEKNGYAVKREEGTGSIADLMPLGAVGIAGAMVTYNGGKEDVVEDKDVSKIGDVTDVAANIVTTPKPLFNDELAVNNTTNTPVASAEDKDEVEAPETELGVLEDLVDKHPIDIPEFTVTPSLFEPEKTEEERMVLAEQAMEEYMNRDDGGDAWLASLVGIMEDEE